MAVKDVILVILTLGPAYGLQLRDELVTRTPHRAGLNVGQIYSTLDRLTKAGLIVSDSATDDNLPLYALTSAGRQAAADWLDSPTEPDVKNWLDMADQVLVASSIPGAGWRDVVSAQVTSWSSRADAVASVPQSGSGTVQLSRAQSADRHVTRAAIDWLRETEAELSAADDPGMPLRSIRPQRGRRPGPSSRP
jgi:DNA-binding PadR family transcriptional regulator